MSDEVSIPWLAEATEGYSGAEIEAVCREAAMLALRAAMHEWGGCGYEEDCRCGQDYKAALRSGDRVCAVRGECGLSKIRVRGAIDINS